MVLHLFYIEICICLIFSHEQLQITGTKIDDHGMVSNYAIWIV